MHSPAELEDYKGKVELLQEKLQKSEENRENLEQQLNIILQKHDDRKRYLYKQSRRRYEQFLDEQKKHSERNKRLMHMLDGINQETTALAARTERLKKLKLQYEMYVANIMQSQTVGCISSSASEINGSMKSIPILVPTSVSENFQGAKAVMEELSQTLSQAGNMAIPAELNACQWRFAMATPLPAGLLLMPTSSISSPPAKLTNLSKAKSDVESFSKNTSQDDFSKKVENREIVSKSHGFSDENTESILKNHHYTNEKLSKDKLQEQISQENKSRKVPTKPAEEGLNYIEVAPISSYNSDQLAYENYKTPLSLQDEKKILNYSYVKEEISPPPKEYIPDIENLEAKVDELQILADSAPKEDKTNIENIENAIYGEIVEPIEDNLYLSSDSTGLDNNAINPVESNYEIQENLLDENTYKSSFDGKHANYAPEMDSNAGDFKYEPTLVTTEAELYSQSTLAPNQTNDFENNSQYMNDDNNQVTLNEPIYENVGYANYEAQQYANPYENVENVYDNSTVYPGYKFDAATGQYLSDETDVPILADNVVNYETENVVYEENPKPLEAYDENNYSENIDNSVVDNVDVANKYEAAIPIEENLDTSNEPQLQGKSVKPILSTPSSSASTTGNGTNEAQKKKKRVNFVDNKSGKESIGLSDNPVELSTSGSSGAGKIEKQKL